MIMHATHQSTINYRNRLALWYSQAAADLQPHRWIATWTPRPSAGRPSTWIRKAKDTATATAPIYTRKHRARTRMPRSIMLSLAMHNIPSAPHALMITVELRQPSRAHGGILSAWVAGPMTFVTGQMGEVLWHLVKEGGG